MKKKLMIRGGPACGTDGSCGGERDALRLELLVRVCRDRPVPSDLDCGCEVYRSLP